ncbi:MAG: 4-hydroxy-tetrahydrodipicolinate synthase [Actinomycetia bacterium]|nr:4-hydroxy-tetrahydrodipicolinate synthase [Actinomycetes bacterium]MCP3909381.1 4-hydroxy-tetrahydrodipicolinate synthase [Actinomycetes bacterium]MCP4087641.1 4-hydroxy-tetrahydrodipicolinate synthase [Actinomycetes bacterium]
MAGRFGAVLTAMVTPFDDKGTLDLDRAIELAHWLLGRGNDGLVIAGTTGESATLSHDEQIALIEAVAGSVDAPVVAGTGSNDTRASVELTQRATEAGATGILSVTPYYNRPSQEGIYEHFKATAQATDRPVVLYDIPARSGRKIETPTLLRLAELDNVVAVKDAAGNPSGTAEFLAEAPDGFELYSGDDSLTLPFLSVGGVGVIGVCTHWTGVEMGEMIAAFEAGDVARAAAINRTLIPSYNYEAMDDAPNPVPSKAMLRVLGMDVGGCRLPMGPEPADLEDRAKAVAAGLA